MALIHLTTFVAAPPERVFDLSRSVSLHKATMTRHKERAVAGRLSGLMEPGETVTWKARHLFKERTLETKITAYNRPDHFTDEQIAGDFETLKHEHHFKKIENGTLMIDQFWFMTPYGKFGQLFSAIYLEKYLKKLLEDRNAAIKATAESSKWKQYLT